MLAKRAMAPFKKTPHHSIIGIDCMLCRLFSPFEVRACVARLVEAASVEEAKGLKANTAVKFETPMKKMKLGVADDGRVQRIMGAKQKADGRQEGEGMEGDAINKRKLDQLG